MSGIETVKIIVDAEKQAAKMINDAMNEASAIRKKIDSIVQTQRREMLAEANSEAASIAARAEEEGRFEAEQLEKQSTEALKAIASRASARRDATVEKLVTMMLQVE